MPSVRRLFALHGCSRTTRLRAIGALAAGCLAASAQAQLSDIGPQSLPDATINHGYSVRLTPVNPFNGLPVLWNITPGCLDGSGLAFSPQGGVAASARISGVPTRRGTFECTVTAQDAAENTVNKVYELAIGRACNSPRITSQPPSATIDPGVPFSYAVTATGRLPQTFSALGLPPGLAINPSTGVISGTTDAGGSYGVTVVVAGCGRNAIQSFTLVVGLAPVTLEMASTPNPAVFGQDIAVSVHAAGGNAAPTGAVLLCAVPSGQFCAPPAGSPPPGTPPNQIVMFSSAPLDANGDAAFTLQGLPIQNYIVQAYYGGDATHATALSTPVDQFVIKGVVLPPQEARVDKLRTRRGPLADPPAPIPASSLPALAVLSLGILLAAFRRARRR
jgi:hypothetical protein